MIGVKVTTYKCDEPKECLELLVLLIEELANPDFPEKVNVLIGQTTDALTVYAIEPVGVKWDWGEGFKRFSPTTQHFLARF